jgi:hypothetical protein
VLFALDDARPCNEKKIAGPDANITDLKRSIHGKKSMATDSHGLSRIRNENYPCDP